MSVTYSSDGSVAYFNGRRYRRESDGRGYYVGHGWQDRLHRAVWIDVHGPIPEGYHIHHIDHNTSNNDISNLCLLEGKIHMGNHLSERVNQDPAATRAHLESIRPLASEWHRSEEGREWHRRHALNVVKNLQPKEFVCLQCGVVFARKPLGPTKFCSNACKSAYRRDIGVDNEERTCEVCGKLYVINKYRKTKTCSRSCANKIRWRTIREAGRAG